MNILGMGPMELLLIVVLALIVFGPAKLPEIMGQVGKAIGDFRRATSDLSDEFNKTIQAELQEGRSVITETKAAVSDVHTTVNSAVMGTPAPTLVAAPGEVVTATNGTTAEPHTESLTNGDGASNNKPPLADTTQWSWETAAPPPPKPDPEVSSTGDATSAVEAPHTDEAQSTADSATPETTRERTRDDLLPPY